MPPSRILISGGGIAGLTLAIALKRHGFDPVVIEREPALRREGYMMDFFGTGWDVAERMGLVPALRAVRYPIDALAFVDTRGRPFEHVPIERIGRALDDNYVYLRRQDLERILAARAGADGVAVRYGRSIAALRERDDGVTAAFDDGSEEDCALVVGADGVHSNVRGLVFGPEAQFARFLGLYVAAFHLRRGSLPIDRAATIYEEPGRLSMVYPLDAGWLDATFVFRERAPLTVPHAERLAFLRERFRGAGWIVDDVLAACPPDTPVFFDSVTQIVMPQWHRGRVALIGDACGCLTLLAGQGSHFAMAGGYVLARELERAGGDHRAAFAAYQDVLKKPVRRKQNDAARFAGIFVPRQDSWPWLRRLAIRALFSRPFIKIGLAGFGVKSALAGYR